MATNVMLAALSIVILAGKRAIKPQLHKAAQCCSNHNQLNIINIIVILYISQFMRGVSKARSHFYMDNEKETWIAKIRRDVGTHVTLDYAGGALNIFIAIHRAQVRETKIRTGESLQDYAGYSGTVREQSNASHFVFKCTRFACR